jgi:hypothetical protein
MSHGVGFAGSAATARRLAVPSLGMTVNCRAAGQAEVGVVHLLIIEEGSSD